jgi:hypothetical protein
LFSNVEENIKYFQIANNFTSIAIERNDKLPTRICEECSSKLILFHKFKIKCEKSRSDLETLYNLLYKISPAEQTKRQEELAKKYEDQQKQEHQQQDVEENYEIVEVLEEDTADDASHLMPIIDEEYPFVQENNSYNVHLSEQGGELYINCFIFFINTKYVSFYFLFSRCFIHTNASRTTK